MTTQKHSARIEAADLAALIDNLKLGPVHLVGVSYGGYTAFVLALKHPELVRTLTLAEPALAGWLPAITQGTDIYHDFRTRMWEPSAEAARAGDIETSISIALDYLAFDGAWSAFSPEVQAEILKNGREWEALTRSADAFPDKAPVAAESLQMPLLVISGGNSLAMHKLIDAEIVERRPQAQRVIIEGATHQMCSEKPAICKDAVRSMLEQYGG